MGDGGDEGVVIESIDGRNGLRRGARDGMTRDPDHSWQGAKWTGPAESARPQLSLRLAKLLRLSGEGRRDGELGVPGMVADVGMSSMADEEDD